MWMSLINLISYRACLFPVVSQLRKKKQQQKPKPTTTLSFPSCSKDLIRNKEIVLNLDMLIPWHLCEIG